MKLNVLTNSRPTQDLGAVLVAGVTDGNIKVSPDFAKLIGVAPGSNMAVAEDLETADENGNCKVYAYAGDSEAGIGNKLAKSGNYFQMSSKNVWNILGGNDEKNRFFIPVGDPVKFEGMVLQEIVWDRDQDKIERNASESAEPAQDNGGEGEEEEEEA